MVGWHHRVDEHEFQQTLGDGEGLGDLAQGGLESMGSQKVRCE